MKILLTGATGYVGRRLLPVLVNAGHTVICLVRDKRRFDWEDFADDFLQHISVVEGNLEDPASLKTLPKDIDAAYYLVHSLNSTKSFSDTEHATAENFVEYLDTTSANQLIYLGGIANADKLSKHLASRKSVEDVLRTARASLTVLRAAIIIGSGSASFEIIRDLVEKLPVMIAPKWLHSRCQPIAIRNVIEYLVGVLNNSKTLGKTYDIGGPDIFTYKDILMKFAEVRGLNRYIFTVPVLTPRLSSLWLHLVTTTSYPLARNLVDSMVNDVIVEVGNIDEVVPVKKLTYTKALKNAFSRINQKNIISSWKDAVSNRSMPLNFMDFIDVPDYGCLRDRRSVHFPSNRLDQVRDNLWHIGGERGWYFGNWLWKIRGMFDKLVGGVGLRRGRRSPNDLKAGDALDFWRVILADEKKGRLLLFAEMKLTGEAWLDFRIKQNGEECTLIQTATFRPLGLFGRLYWFILIPFHAIIFPLMARNLIRYTPKSDASAELSAG